MLMQGTATALPNILSSSNSGGDVNVTIAAGAVVIQVPENASAADIAAVQQSVNDGFSALGREVLAGAAPLRH
jgi:hypothetical protein